MKKQTVYHKDGSVWAKGSTQDGKMVGKWQWWRKDGTILRSGHFKAGEQVGEWITYDKHGKAHTVKQIKSSAAKSKTSKK